MGITHSCGGSDRGACLVGQASADRRDEIGAMAKAVLTFRDGLREAERLRAEQENAGRAAEARRSALSSLISRPPMRLWRNDSRSG